MSDHPVLEALARHVVTPVVREADAERARDVVAALREGGFPVFEVTRSVPGATDLVAELVTEPDLVVGIGTVLSGTDATRAVGVGADAVEVFSAASVGGPAHVKALRSVLPDVPLIPTGGIDLTNLRDSLEAGVHSVGVGGALSPPDLSDAPGLARRYREAAQTLAPSPGGSPDP